jgi:3-deoxy-D-manno-octulosonic-acid transferase
MHCASLGEFEQGRPVLERIRDEHPEALMVLTFYSPSGYEQQANYPHADYIAYLPADGPGRAKAWIAELRPKLVIFVKYEFWAFYLRELFQGQVPVVLIGGVFRADQLFFRWYGGFFLQLLKGFDRLFVQREVDAELLKTHGVDKVTVAGDPRIDRVLEIARGEIDFPLVAAFKQHESVFIGGSTWPPGERILLKDQEQWRTGWKLLLAPHDIGEAHIQQLEAQLQLPYCRYSQQPSEEELQRSRVLIVDTIGMLSRLYHYGDLAYIGGGFGVSIHNILEPAAHGLPVLIGPTHHKFQEAQTLLAEGGAFEINNEEEFRQRFTSLQKTAEMKKARTAVSEYLRANAGATNKIMEGLGKL